MIHMDDPHRQLLDAAISVYGDESFLPTDEITKRIMANSHGDEWWCSKWTTQRAAAMHLASALQPYNVRAERIHHPKYGQRMGYYKADMLGENRKTWWQ